MPLIRYKVTLEAQERVMLQQIATRGRHSSQKVLNALILLKCDEGQFQDRKLTNQEIADVLPVSMKKIDRIKKRFVEQGGQTKGRADIHKKGGRGLRGASDRLELRQTAPRSRPLVVALAGRQDGGVAVHRFDFS
jgi:hypothetical protein